MSMARRMGRPDLAGLERADMLAGQGRLTDPAGLVRAFVSAKARARKDIMSGPICLRDWNRGREDAFNTALELLKLRIVR